LTARRRATQQRLIASARAVVAVRGLEGASVEDICEQAGFTRGAFYSNFSGKNDLVVALTKDLTERRKSAAGTGVPTATVAQTAAALGIEQFFGAGPDLVEDVQLVTELQLWAIRHPEYRAVHAGMVNDTLDYVRRAFDTFLESYNLEYAVEPETAIRTLHALLDYYRLRSLVDTDAASLNGKLRMLEVFGVLFRPKTVLNGGATPPQTP
jgi:AcrR family transcriptional regulator